MTGALIFLLITALPAAEKLPAAPALNVGELDQKPKLIKAVEPTYPFLQARAGLGAAVSVEFVIDKKGNVQNAIVIESNNPAFERPALDAVLKWKFSPGVKNGEPVFVKAQQKIEFAMRYGPTESSWIVQKRKDHASLPTELQWDIAPEPVATAFPVYPFDALTAQRKGIVVVSFIVGLDGRVAKATVIEATTPEMGWAAEAAVDKWRFNPAKKKDGTLCYASLGLRYEFKPSGDGDVPVSPAALKIMEQLKNRPESVVPASQLDALPKPLSRRSPVYPLALRNGGQVGEAVIEFFVDQQGDAQLPRIVSATEPAFGYAAVQAVATWRFEPAMKNGRKVVTRVRVPVAFNLNQPPEKTAP